MRFSQNWVTQGNDLSDFLSKLMLANQQKESETGTVTRYDWWVE
jgi:hypothetical protein